MSQSARRKSGGASFLARFDVIFTLNQDLLLERHYQRAIPVGPPRNWSGVSFPGLEPANSPPSRSVLEQRWRPAKTLQVPKTAQPIFKLHGSSNWVDADGKELLIIGGDKIHAISSHEILKHYQKIFVEHIAGDTRLLAIGYSFSDGHIDKLLLDATQTGLRIFIVDPLGSDVVNKTATAPVWASAS